MPIPSGDAPTVGHGATRGAGRPPRSAEPNPDFVTTNREWRRLCSEHQHDPGTKIKYKCNLAIERFHKVVLRRFTKFGGKDEDLGPRAKGETKAERAYAALREMAGRAEDHGEPKRARAIRDDLAEIDQRAAEDLKNLTTYPGRAVSLSVPESPKLSATTAPEFDWCISYRQLNGIYRFFDKAGQADEAACICRVLAQIDARVRHWFKRLGGKTPKRPPLDTGTPHRVEQQYRLLQEMASRSEERGASGAALPGKVREALEIIDGLTVKELNALMRKFGPLDDLAARAGLEPQQAPGFVPIAAGTGAGVEAAQSPPVGASPAAAAAVPAGSSLAPSWLEDDFAVERALIAGELPPGFDASHLIGEARTFAQFGLDTELAAGRLPMETIDALLEGFEITDREGSNALFIDYLRSLKENIEQALARAHPGRVGREWLDQVRELLQKRAVLSAGPAPGADLPETGPGVDGSAGRPPGPADRVPDYLTTNHALQNRRSELRKRGDQDAAYEFELAVHRLYSLVLRRFESLGGETKHLPRRTTVGSVYKSERAYAAILQMASEAESGGNSERAAEIRHALAGIDRRAAAELRELSTIHGPAAPSSAQAPPPPPPLPPWAPEYAGSGAVAVPPLAEPFSEPPGPSSMVMPAPAVHTPAAAVPEQPLERRRAITERFRSEEALVDAGFILGSSGAEALGWPPKRARAVLDDLGRLNEFSGADPAALAGIDWGGIEELLLLMDVPTLAVPTLSPPLSP